METLDKQFHSFVQKEILKIVTEHARYLKDSNKVVVKQYEKQYPFLKKQHPPLESKDHYPSLREVLSWPSTLAKFDTEVLTEVQKMLIAKITGIYKHGQTNKTGLCNRRMISAIRRGILTIAIAKNTLDAKSQWEERLIQDLKKEFPGVPLKNLILVISSKVNDMGGNATHCKSLAEAIASYTRIHSFRIIFVCSNKARVENICVFLKSYDGIAKEIQLPIEIQWDEAHNTIEGIPSKRDLVDHILMNPYVKCVIPVTASNRTLEEEGHPLWNLKNLEMYAINYTQIDGIPLIHSGSPEYSSIQKANQITFEKLSAHPGFKAYNLKEYDEAIFDEADTPGFYSTWNDPEKVKEDKDRRRQLAFCRFMLLEQEAMNYGMNILDNFYPVTYKDDEGAEIQTLLILDNERNIHLLTTPCRVAFTITLIKHALTKSYDPICIGLYRSRAVLWFKNRFGLIKKDFGELGENPTTQQLNDKILSMIQHVEKNGVSTKKPILIFGNYKPTGESITFVNAHYGTLRSTTLLPYAGQTCEASYQGFLRSAYMDIKFKELDPSFKQPPKWICGSHAAIQDAVYYEKENDERLENLPKGDTNMPLSPEITRVNTEDDLTDIAVPCQILISDPEDSNYDTLIDIIKKSKRSETDKKRVLELFKLLLEAGSAEITDVTGKLNLETFILKDIRSWRKHTDEEIALRLKECGKPFEADYRFREYDAKHKTKLQYINNKSKMNSGDCELLVALDVYNYEGYKNPKHKMWLAYKY